MFGIDSSEFLLIAVVALIVIGPKDLPRVMRLVGGWVGRGRAMTRHLRSGFDTMMREAELEEMQKQWAKQNAEIMAATVPATVPPYSNNAAIGEHVADAVVGEHVYDHPGALVDGETKHEDSDVQADRHPRAGGDPYRQTFGSMGPRLRGDDGTDEGNDVAAPMNRDVAPSMTGPRPSPRALAEPAIPLEPTAQP